MNLKLNIKNSIQHILLKDNSTTLLGKNNIIDLNIGLNKLNNENLEYFFTSNKLLGFLHNNFSKKGNIYGNDLYLLYDNYIVFYDLICLNYFFKNKNINNNYEKYGVLHNKKIYFINKDNLDVLLCSFSQNIDVQLYNNLYLFYNSKEVKLLININLIEKNKIIIMNILKDKNLFLNIGNYVYEKNIIDKKIKKYEIINFNSRYINENYLFKNENLFNLNKFSIKIDTSFLSPIISNFRYKKNKFNKNIGFGYGSNYNINDINFLFYYNEKNISTGYDYKNYKLGRVKSFVEGIERYNSGFFNDDNIGNKKLKDFDLDFIEKIIGFKLNNEELEKYYFYNKILKLKSSGDNIILNYEKKYHLPYNILYYPLNINENLFYYANSSGIGAGRNYEEAIMGGLLELSERDSIMLTWLLKLTPNIINNKTLPKNIYDRVIELEQISKGIFYIFDISYDKDFCNILCILKYKDGEDIKINIGASSGFILPKVILKAINEVSVNMFYGGNKVKEIINYTDVINVSDHRFFYCQNRNIKYLYFLFLKNTVIDFDELNKKFDKKQSLGGFLLNLKKNIGGNFYLSDLTTNYSQNLGVYVVRILSENFIPIWFGYNSRLPLYKERLKSSIFQKWKTHKYKYNIPDFLHFFD